MAQSFIIAAARSEFDYGAARRLIEAYAAGLGVDLGYQNFAAELAALAQHYAPPQGGLLLARDAEGTPLGCVALRPMTTAGCCEMKRLYVAPEGRGMGLGRALVQAVIVEAEARGYRELRLDSLPTMAAAITLYKSLGFAEMPAYYDTPIAGTVFLRRGLAPPAAP